MRSLVTENISNLTPATMNFGHYALTIIWIFCTISAIHAVKNIDCTRPEIVNEHHVHFCCKHPDGHNDVTEKCAAESGLKLPSKEEESIVDLTIETVIAGTCFGKCVFKTWKFMKDGKLDMDAVKAHFEKNYPDDPEYVKEMLYAFDHCHSNSETKLASFLSNPFIQQHSQHFCDPLASVILACTIREFFHNCPANRWAKTEECETARAFSLKCKDQLTIM